MITDYCFSWPSHIVADTAKDFTESGAFIRVHCDIHMDSTRPT